MLNKLKTKLKSDKASSEIVSALIILPIVFAILITMIDSAIYFSNRAQIQSTVRDAARSVAIMGGNGTDTTETPIEKKYGQNRNTLCDSIKGNESVSEALNSGKLTAIECNTLSTIANSSGLVNIKITSIKCDPEITDSISERTSCGVEWKYNGLPASGLSFIQNGKTSKTVGTSETEVNMSGQQLVNRD